MDLLPLTPETVELAAAVYSTWQKRVSYYFPIGTDAMVHTLFSQPEVHPGTFEMCQDASLVAVDGGKAAGWIQTGYVSDIPPLAAGSVHGLIRCLMIADGRTDIGAALLDRAIEALSRRPVDGWRAFDHHCGYTFATGIGQAPHRMVEVTDLLARVGFSQDGVNFVYAAKALEQRPEDKDLSTIEVDIRPRTWAEPRANVQWDLFDFHEHGTNVGSAVVAPVKRLTQDENEQTLFVKGIEVAEAHHRRGIGHLIMTTLWDHYHPQGIDRLLLNTGDDNLRAQGFYEAIGFELTDRTSPYAANAVTSSSPWQRRGRQRRADRVA